MRTAAQAQVAAGLCRLSEHYGLPDGAVDRLHRLLELVASDPLAPTSVGDPGRILNDHINAKLVASTNEYSRSSC